MVYCFFIIGRKNSENSSTTITSDGQKGHLVTKALIFKTGKLPANPEFAGDEIKLRHCWLWTNSQKAR